MKLAITILLGLGVSLAPTACGGNKRGAGAGPDADAGIDVVCECSGDVMTGAGMSVVPDSGTGPCGQPRCEDDCGHQWTAVCGSAGFWVCQSGSLPPPSCSDAGAE